MTRRRSRERRRHHRWWRSGPKGVTFGTEIPTLFSWISPDDQRDRAAFLEEIAHEPAVPGAGEAGQGARTGHDEAEQDSDRA